MRLSWLYLRSRGLTRTIPMASICVALLGARAPHSIPVILGDDQQRLRTPAVIGLAAAICAGPGLAAGLSEAEWVARNALRRCRALHLLLVLALAEVLAAAVSGTLVWTTLHQQVLANASGLIGLTLLTVSLTSLPFWIVTLPVVATSYLLGAAPSGHPRPWAWLLWEPKMLRWQELIDLGLFCCGLLAFLGRPGRTSSADG